MHTSPAMDTAPSSAPAAAAAISPSSPSTSLSPSPSPSPSPSVAPSSPSHLLPSASATATLRSISLLPSSLTSPLPSTPANDPSPLPPLPAPSKERDPQTWNYVWKTFLAGGIAGCAAKSVVAPLDRVKILFQTNSPHFAHHRGSLTGVFRAALDIRNQHGLSGLFQGHSATLIRIFPYAAIKFMAFEQYKHAIFPKDGRRAGPGHQLLAGSLAGVTSVFCTYPLEVVRVRLAFSRDPHSLRSLLKVMWREKPHVHHPLPKRLLPEGLANFYRGFLPTVYGMIPYAGVSFATYESTKRHLHERFPGWSVSGTHLVAGGLAGAISQTVAYPLEVIRRRMQVSGQFHVESFEARVYRTTVETARYIWRHHGIKGFFVGLSIGYMKVVPMSMVSFWTYEASKRLLGIE